ncbi:MAG: C45 family autoproteolytic acyltransferase/hydrolase [bacterium]
MTNENFVNAPFPLPRNSGPASLRSEKGMLVMHTSGSFEEMGRQHGELVRGVVDDYVMEYYRNMIEVMVAHSAVSHISRAIPPRIAKLLYYIFHRANRKTIGEPMIQLQKGFTDALGLPNKVGERVIIFADILHFLAGRAMAPMAMPALGCSAFYARGAATQGGKQILGRNFDFYGRGLWDAYQCVKVFHPKDSQSYFWIGAVGIPVGGFAMNQSGICIMPFTNFIKDVAISGRPLFTLAGEILSNATNLSEAVKIMETGPRIGGLSFLIGDTRAGDAAAVGFTSHHMEIVRPEKDYLVRTNHHVTEEMQKLQVAPTAWWRHSTARYMRLSEMIKERYGRLTLDDAVDMMSDAVDPREGRKRIVGDIVASTNNAMSIVLSPDEDTIYIANGSFPVCFGEKYIGLKLSELFKGGANSADAGDLAGGAGKLNVKEKEALEHYEQAWTEHLNYFDDARAVFHLRRAAEILPDEPIFDRMAGLFLLKLGRFEDALAHLSRNSAYEYRDSRMKAESLLWLARGNDLIGRRDQAIQLYRKAIEQNDKEISCSAERGLRKPYKKNSLLMMDLEPIIGNPIVKYT